MAFMELTRQALGQQAFRLLEFPPAENALAAHCYEKEGSSGASASASINILEELREFTDFCSRPVRAPEALLAMLPAAREVWHSRRRAREDAIENMLQEQGDTYFCKKCAAAVAFQRVLRKTLARQDGSGGHVQVAEFTRAGGCVAVGHPEYESPPRIRQLSGTGGFRNFQGSPIQAWANRQPAQMLMPASGWWTAAPRPGDASAAWFPGWWRRDAICRHCGESLGWRYEKKEDHSLFWALDAAQLQRRQAPKQSRSPQTTASSTESTTSQARQEIPSQKPAQEPAACGGAPKERDAPTADVALASQSTAAGSRSSSPQSSQQSASCSARSETCADRETEVERAPLKVDRASSARGVVSSLSSDLQDALAHGLACDDHLRFDRTLNSLRLDNATAKLLLKELRARPCGLSPTVTGTHLQRMLEKRFRHKVGELRCYGLKALLACLPEDAVRRTATSDDQRLHVPPELGQSDASAAAKKERSPTTKLNFSAWAEQRLASQTKGTCREAAGASGCLNRVQNRGLLERDLFWVRKVHFLEIPENLEILENPQTVWKQRRI